MSFLCDGEALNTIQRLVEVERRLKIGLAAGGKQFEFKLEILRTRNLRCCGAKRRETTELGQVLVRGASSAQDRRRNRLTYSSFL